MHQCLFSPPLPLVIKRDALLADLISGTDWLPPGNEPEGSMPIKHLRNFSLCTAERSIRLITSVSTARFVSDLAR